MEKWRVGLRVGRGEIEKNDVAGVTEVGMYEVYQRMARRAAWQEQKCPVGSGGA